MAINICGSCLEMESGSCPIDGISINAGIDNVEHPFIDITIITPWGDDYHFINIQPDGGGVIVFDSTSFPEGSFIQWNGSFIITAIDSATQEPILFGTKPCINMTFKPENNY
jgi:hypothetical protein